MVVVLLAVFLSFLLPAQTVIMIGSTQFPPYVYPLGDGTIAGVAAEIVDEVFRTMGVPYKNTTYPWSRALRMLTNGEIHALFTMMKNAERAAIFYYPEESLLYSRWVFFIRRADAGTLKFDSFDDLKGKTIGLSRDVKYTEAFWEFINREKNYELVTRDRQNLQKLMANRVDYVLCEYTNGMVLSKELGIENDVLPLLHNPVDSTPLYIGFSPMKVDREFVDRFSDELKKFKSGSQYQEILDKYNIP